MAQLHVWNFPLYFTPAFAKLCANDGSPYIHMNVLCKVEMFSLPENYFFFQWLSILFLSPVLFLSTQCRWGEIPLSSKFQPCLTGTKNSFHDSVEGTSAEIPGLQENNPRNLTALWFLLRLENGNTAQLNSINFSSLHHGVVILAQKSSGLFSVYMATFLLSSSPQSPAKYRVKQWKLQVQRENCKLLWTLVIKSLRGDLFRCCGWAQLVHITPGTWQSALRVSSQSQR